MRIWLIKVLFNSVDTPCYSNTYKACMWSEAISPLLHQFSVVLTGLTSSWRFVLLYYPKTSLPWNQFCYRCPSETPRNICSFKSSTYCSKIYAWHLDFSLEDNPKIFISPPFFAERGELCIDPWFLFSILQLQIYRDSLALPLFQRGHIFKFVKFPKEYNLQMLFKNVMA